MLQRYELLYEAGLVAEAPAGRPTPVAGRADDYDHRRILATGIARLRAKIKYRPVVFELMPPRFTLLQLQRAVEALAGRRLHKQNFRRLVEQQGLVEETGEMATRNRRPAGQALPLPPRRGCRAGRRGKQAAARALASEAQPNTTRNSRSIVLRASRIPLPLTPLCSALV